MAPRKRRATTERAPTRAEQTHLGRGVLPEESLWDQVARIGGSLNPAVISAIMRDADTGRIQRLVDLTHDLRQKDGHIHGVLQTREQAVSRLPWDIVTPEKSLKKFKKAANRLKEALQSAEGFHDCKTHHVGESLLFPASTSEVIWNLDDDGVLVPKKFKLVPTRRFGFRTSDGQLLFDAARVGDVNVGGVDLLAQYPAGKFLQLRRRVNGDVPVREGLCRVICWKGSFRNWTDRDWLLAAEIGWKPWRKVRYNKNASAEDKNHAREIAHRMNSSGVAIYNKDALEVDIDWPKGAIAGQSTTHKELADHLGMEISKAVLGGTLTVESGSRGARSLGEVHNEVRKDLIESDAVALGALFTFGLVMPFMRMNYGERAPLTMFVIQTKDQVDLKAYAEAIKTFGDAGLKNIPAAHVRDVAGIPEAEEGDEVLEPPKPTAPKPPGGKPDDDEEDPEDSEDES